MATAWERPLVLWRSVLFEQKPIGTMVIVSDLSEVARR